VNSHLITIEVSVKRGTHQWVNLDCLTFDQLWFESLDSQTVQGRCTVQENWMLSNNFLKNIPHDWTSTLDHTLCGLDVLSVIEINQTLHYKWLEELESHLLWQTALVQLELWTNNDYRTSRVVNALSEQVLTETTLLTLQHI
jgi:hypothetical protein